ncbi:phospholipase ddhd2 isoform 1 [Plasmopara halstedii]|uniref:Phospholipase ddhd2 isoform 1 n=1 Tax=Plasmopara halstedii TaxID=4781 RepID=A0A0P1AGL2_PLAHL|nr:phospholipase ddhd2 isoform 1 [Plasmopara halstedii]CEG39906.1 phospholipase ddhd2 isoform 1 [Plasmopara halstedii]|eukprot:XP_024576275.1 phospholipase ddhd2 isoform 1 [Plasmopara halstedii]
MYHLAEMVRDAQRDMAQRHDGSSPGFVWSTLSAFTPFPFLLALCGQISSNLVRRAPDLAKRAAGATRDCVVDAVTQTQELVVDLRLACTRSSQRLFYRMKLTIETTRLPGPLTPLQTQVAIPFLCGIEGLAQFVMSEELPELYFVAKNTMRRNFFLRHLVLPPLGAAESVVRYVVIFPGHIVFPSRAEIEDRTDLFLEGSTTRVQALVEHLYSATEVLDQHLSIMQWNILGRGPYESLGPSRRSEVIRSVYQRMRIIVSHFKLFEFLATMKLQNEMLYLDLLREYPSAGGVPLTSQQIAANQTLKTELADQDANAFPIWFYKKMDVTSGNGQVLPSGLNGRFQCTNKSRGWIEFPAHESRRLERKYRWYQGIKSKILGTERPSSIVLVDEGRHEVDLEIMRMKPVYWPALEEIVVCRSYWVYAQRSYGLAPYSEEAASDLESAFVYFLALYPSEKQRLMTLEAQRPRGIFSSRNCLSETVLAARVDKDCTLSIPIEGHLVEFKGSQDIVQHKRLLAGSTSFTSKRRVYRGNPRVRADPIALQLWKDAMECNPVTGNSLKVSDGDNDINDEIEHLVLVIHGIGDALKTLDLINVVTLRSIIDCSTTLRELNLEALRSAHFAHHNNKSFKGDSTDNSKTIPGRRCVEFLPIEWHSKLHMEGLDRLIRDVTLPAIPKLRELANDTILDVLFFMSPLFHQVILNEVAKEMNRVFNLFQSRHPDWTDPSRAKRKKVSIIAHSLGSIICFDILNHQHEYIHRQEIPLRTDVEDGSEEEDVVLDENTSICSDNDSEAEESVAATDNIIGLDRVVVNQQLIQRSHSMSEMSDLNEKWTEFSCKRHKYASRQQPHVQKSARRSLLRAPDTYFIGKKKARNTLRGQKMKDRKDAASTGTSATVPVVPKLAFDVENLFCFGSPIGLFLNVRGQKIGCDFRLPRCRRLFNIYHPYDPVAYRIEPIINPLRAHSKAAIIRTFEGKLRFQYQLRNTFRATWASLRQWRRDFERKVLAEAHSVGLVENSASITPLFDVLAGVSQPYELQQRSDKMEEDSQREEREGDEIAKSTALFGHLCQGRPIDYSLQENEIEIANEYLFALTAHVIYWNNRDASLFVAQKLILEPAIDDWPVTTDLQVASKHEEQE